MKWLQRAALWLLLGALLGSVFVLFLYPYYMAYETQPIWGEGACKWADCVEMTSSRLKKAQLLGAAIGALLAVAAGEFWLWRRRKKNKTGEGNATTCT